MADKIPASLSERINAACPCIIANCALCNANDGGTSNCHYSVKAGYQEGGEEIACQWQGHALADEVAALETDNSALSSLMDGLHAENLGLFNTIAALEYRLSETSCPMCRGSKVCAAHRIDPEQAETMAYLRREMPEDFPAVETCTPGHHIAGVCDDRCTVDQPNPGQTHFVGDDCPGGHTVAGTAATSIGADSTLCRHGAVQNGERAHD